MPSSNMATANPNPILFVHYGDNWIRGSERCLLDLLNHLNKDDYAPVCCCNSPIMAAEVNKLGIPVYLLDFSMLFGDTPPKFDFRAYHQLVKKGLSIVDQHDISLIHCNSGAPSQWLNLVARARKLPLVLHLHARYPLRDRITLGLHHASMVVGVSQPIIDQLLLDGTDPNRCTVIANGIDTTALLAQPIENIRRSLSLPSDAFVMVSVCSLIKRKGVDLLIDACAKLRDIRLSVHLVVIGEGEQRAALQQQINHAKLNDFVHLVGEKQHVVGVLRGGVDICVSGAREEVFGLTLAEAGLANLAVIAPRVGGIPSVIEHQKTGLLVEPNNADALAQAIYHLFINQQQRQAMGAAGYQRVMEKFTIHTHVKKMVTLYQRLLCDAKMATGWLTHWQWMPPIKASCLFLKNHSHLFAKHLLTDNANKRRLP